MGNKVDLYSQIQRDIEVTKAAEQNKINPPKSTYENLHVHRKGYSITYTTKLLIVVIAREKNLGIGERLIFFFTNFYVN